MPRDTGRPLRRQVGDKDAVHSGLLGGSAESFQAEAKDRIEVGEDDEARAGALRTQSGGKREDIMEAGPVFHGTFAGALDHGAVGEGIAEGNTEFEDIGAGVDRGHGDVWVVWRSGSPTVR